MKRVAQVAIEVLVLMGIIVIGSIILGITYINSHNKNIQISSDVSVVQGEVQKELKYTGAYNPSSVSCGNLLCESDFGETTTNCPQDCTSTPPPAIEQNCVFSSGPTFSPAIGSLTPVDTITISPGAQTNCTDFNIYYTYTINGGSLSDPTDDSNKYSSGILVYSLANPSEGSSVTLKIKAIVYADSVDGDPTDVNSSVTSVTYTVTNPYCFSGTGSGEGTEENPIIICNLKELNDVRDKLDAHYLLGKDIDLSEESFMAEGLDYNPEEGWEPLGSEENPFTGSFDGNGHKLSNLFISREDNVGFFGYVIESNISNLYLVDSEIKANNYSGVLIGYSENSEINNCSATGEINGNENIGGLIGYSIYSQITESFSSVNINANESAGGFIGTTKDSVISNCFSRGDVIAQSDFAGFIGITEDGDINFSYSTGLVKKGTGGDIKDSGFIKKNNYCIINGSYWDIETSLQENSDGGVGKTTEEMKMQDNYPDWDFSNIWEQAEEINNDYPYLRNNLIIKTE